MEGSTVISFLEILWRNTKNGGWTGLNNSMYHGLMLAISSGFKFDVDDFDKVSKRFRLNRWMGDGEGLYAKACECNTSAAMSFEKHISRKPFMLHGKRLAVRSEFKWVADFPAKLAGEELILAIQDMRAISLTVNSFPDNNEYINAGFYSLPSWERERGKGPDKRFKITRDDLKRYTAAKKLFDKKVKAEELGEVTEIN